MLRTPMHNGKKMLEDKFKDKLIFVGQNYPRLITFIIIIFIKMMKNIIKTIMCQIIF